MWLRKFASLLKFASLFILVVFILPALASLAWWMLQDRPANWRAADWSSSGLLRSAPEADDAAIHVLAARTGGAKGAFAVHSWIVIKKPGRTDYERYDKVGWGNPIRRNAYAADGRWYSNAPAIVATLQGKEAERLIPAVERAIAGYPYSHAGDYTLWPGPNSNSFVAHVLHEVPDLGAVLPPNAIGRDFAPGVATFDIAPDRRDVHATLAGLVGFAAGARSGLELHFMGLVAGIDIARPALKIPAYGRLELFTGT